MSVAELRERHVVAMAKVNTLREWIKDKRHQLLDTDVATYARNNGRTSISFSFTNLVWCRTLQGHTGKIVNSSSEPDVEASVILIKDMIVCLNTSSLYREGFLDEQFMQIQQLQEESNPESVVEVVSLFFEDAEKLLADLSKTLAQQPVDFKKVDAHVHQFKGSSSR